MDDRTVVSWQLGRPARTFRRVAVRCAHGFPAVTEQAPFDPDGRPFPTTFYLTCPWLVAAISRVEAAGGVERWSRAAAEDRRLGESVARAAFALARPGYELGEAVLAEAGERWCPDARCARALEAADPP